MAEGAQRRSHFLALPIGARVARRLCRCAAAIAPEGTRHAHWKDLHLTLYYLGLCDSLSAYRVTRGLTEIAVSGPIRVALTVVAAFDETGGRHIVALPDRPSRRRLERIAGAIRQRLEPVSAPASVRRPFVPHVTLARIARAGTRPRPVSVRALDTLSEVVLYRTGGGLDSGVRYVARKRWPLPGTDTVGAEAS